MGCNPLHFSANRLICGVLEGCGARHEQYVTIGTVNALIDLRGVTGNLDVRRTNGEVTQERASNRTAKHPISARTTNGSVTIEGTDR